MEESARLTWEAENKRLRVDMEGLDAPLFLKAKLFKSGSVGWYLSEKVTLSDTKFQLSVCLTMVKSKREQPTTEVNGESPYPDGLQLATDLLDQADKVNPAFKTSRKRPKRS